MPTFPNVRLSNARATDSRPSVAATPRHGVANSIFKTKNRHEFRYDPPDRARARDRTAGRMAERSSRAARAARRSTAPPVASSDDGCKTPERARTKATDEDVREATERRADGGDAFPAISRLRRRRRTRSARSARRGDARTRRTAEWMDAEETIEIADRAHCPRRWRRCSGAPDSSTFVRSL